jgi:hypothetical protein
MLAGSTLRFASCARVATFFPLLLAGTLFGYVDQLRDHYEALPLSFALIVQAWRKIRDVGGTLGATATVMARLQKV